MQIILSILYTLAILLLLVFVHEVGHFTVAKLCNTRVDELSLGMGPVIFQKKKGETKYSLRALPLGGYCAFFGEVSEKELSGEDGETEAEKNEKNELEKEIANFSDNQERASKDYEATEEDHSRDLAKKSWWQKTLILLAGAMMNVIVCIIILAGIVFFSGTVDNTIGQVDSGSPAAEAGIVAGSKITAINGHEVTSWNDMVGYITEESEAGSLKVTFVKPNEEAVTVNIVPATEEDGRHIIGIRPLVQHKPLYSLKVGVSGTWELTRMMYRVLAGFIDGSTSKDAISGPVGMINAVGSSASKGFIYVAYIAALISLNLAIINLLPFPSLDGGRIIFVWIRAVTGKAITDEFESKFHFAGIMIIIMLLVYVTFNDVTKLFGQ